MVQTVSNDVGHFLTVIASVQSWSLVKFSFFRNSLFQDPRPNYDLFSGSGNCLHFISDQCRNKLQLNHIDMNFMRQEQASMLTEDQC